MSSKTQLAVIQEIIDASRQGREVICLIGAGLSVESGIPPLAKLTQYLAKVQSYITNAAFRPQTRDPLPRFGEEYRANPSHYLRDFGWPDPNQLNAELWGWIDQKFFAGRDWRDCPDYRNYLEYQVRTELIEDLLRFDPSLEKGLDKIVRDARTARRRRHAGEMEAKLFASEGWKKALRTSGLWRVGGNWRTLLSHLTDANPDYADTLFQSLIRNRRPGMAQRFLAFLTPILGMRLFLTVNFDDLLEEALRYEGLHPVVYAVSRDSPLPHPSLVRSQLSVVKLHGDAFRLRLGEDLDQPLDEDSQKRLQDYLPDKPLLLVLGVGGGDRRVMDFVELVARKPRDRRRRFATVYWFHFEAQCPESVAEIRRRSRAIQAVRTHSPASLLLELFSRLAGTHPPSFRSYDPKMPRPIVIDSGGLQPRGRTQEDSPEPPVRVFLDDAKQFDFGASLDLARFVTEKSGTHIPIWLDLEAMHTYEDVVVEIIRQIRRYDRSVPPIALPGGPAPDAKGVEKAVRRICDALLRDRYIVAFNGVASFGRPPTWHHGRASTQHPPEESRQAGRTRFLLELAKTARSQRRPLRDSILAFSMHWENVDPALRDELSSWRQPPARDRKPNAGEAAELADAPLTGELGEDYQDALMLLAAFRRRRSYVALLQLLPDYLPEPPEGKTWQEHVDAFLKNVEERHVLRLLGGEYWMCRRIRDKIYLAGRKNTFTRDLLLAFRSPRDGAPDLESLFRLSLITRIHAAIARYCHDLFAASGEPSALIEHLYHQVSSLRYLTKLDAWLRLAFDGEPPEEARRVLGDLVRQETYQHESSPTSPGKEAASLRWLRLQRLRALRRVFEREREILLSLVSADTLIGWIDWLQSDDLGRFQAATCLESGNDPEALQALRARLGREPLALRRPEEAIARHCRELDSQLADLKADALRDEMDFSNCQEVRLQQIHDLFGAPRKTPGLAGLENLWRQEIGPWFQRGEDHLHGLKDSMAMRRLVWYLYDIWLCLRGQGALEPADRLRDQVWEVIEESRRRFGSETDERGADLEAMMVRWLRSAADHELMAASPWTLRGAPKSDKRDVATRCQNAVRVCDEALRTLEWATGDTYARYRSYFQSLKGRAQYLRAFLMEGESEAAMAVRWELFAEAHRELDWAQAGLPPRIGANREALAISLLRLAECLMVRANTALDRLDPREPGKDSLARDLTSARRRLERAGNVLDQAENILIGARQNVEWWACLYQLRAQIQVERLLYQLAIPRPKRNRTQEREEQKTVSLVPPQILQAGLHAIRQGLDVLLPIRREGEEDRSHFRIERFLRIWIELMVAGASLVRAGFRSGPAAASGPLRQEMESLWDRWKSLNDTAGLEKLVGAEVFQTFGALARQLPARQGPEARLQALALIPECVRPNRLHRLWEELHGS